MLTCLDLITSFIRDGSYVPVAQEDKVVLHESLLDWIRKKEPSAILAIPDYLKTKYAVLVSLLIKMDYPQFWPDVFDVRIVKFIDSKALFQIRSLSPPHLLMYLKVLYYVDEEIVQGAGGIRAPKERPDLDAGMRVKDCLRDNYISIK